MIERAALLLLLAAAGVAAYYLLRTAHMRRMTSAFQVGPAGEPAAANGVPTLLYFRADSCAVCPAQSRYLDQVAESWGGRVAIQRIDAEREAELASRYAVFSLPTTILVDANGQVRQVNYGLTDAGKLSRQLEVLG